MDGEVTEAPIRRAEFMRASNQLSLEGRRFGRLTVVAYIGVRNMKSRWLCNCDCGGSLSVGGSDLTTGNTTSCGCASVANTIERNTVHGFAKRGKQSRTYRIWQAMHNRCRNPKQPNYRDYGGRGITVCARWDSFTLFLKDMGECPPGMTIERSDRDGNYKPGNCKWATRHEQMRNTRRTRFITFNGVTQCLKDWAAQIGIDQASLSLRLRRWPLERALTTPPPKPKGVTS